MTHCLVMSGGFVLEPIGNELYEHYRIVREVCDQVGAWTGVPFPEVLNSDLSGRLERKAAGRIRQIAVSLGVADLLAEMGFRPDAVGGIGLGAMIGASIAGAISRHDLCALAAYEDAAPEVSPDGRDLAFARLLVPAGECPGAYLGAQGGTELFLAVDATGESCGTDRVVMISGYADAVHALAAAVRADPERRGEVSVLPGLGALHSPLNQHIRDFMAPRIDDIAFADPTIPLVMGRREGWSNTAAEVRADITEAFTSFVSAARVRDELAAFGATVGATPGSTAVPDMARYPFPIVPILVPGDAERLLATVSGASPHRASARPGRRRRGTPRPVRIGSDSPREPLDQVQSWLNTNRDEWTRHVVRRHFDPQSGSPYWLAVAEVLPFDPLEIKTYDELACFGPFPLDDLRFHEPDVMVPRAVPRPLRGRVWDAGSSTGTPCRIFCTPPMLEHLAVWRRWMFTANGFRPDKVWLHAWQTGPHLDGNNGWELTDGFASKVYTIDVDPRWIQRLTRLGRHDDAAEYRKHLLNQITALLQTRAIDYLHTSSELLEDLIDARPDLLDDLDGVQLAGVPPRPETYRRFTECFDGGVVGYQYSNTFGLNPGLLAAYDGGQLPCVSNFPVVNTDVVDPVDGYTIVDHGQTGRVRLTVLSEDLFLPNVLERDQAVRFDTGGSWPTDGIAHVAPLQEPECLY